MIACYLAPTVQLGLICCIRLSFSNIFLWICLSPEESGCRCTCTEAPRHCLFELPVEYARVFKQEKPEKVVDLSCLLRQQISRGKVHVLLSVWGKVPQTWFQLVLQWFCSLTVTVPLVKKKKKNNSKLALNSLLWVFPIIFAWLLCGLWSFGSEDLLLNSILFLSNVTNINMETKRHTLIIEMCEIVGFLQKPQEVANISADGNYFFHLQIITQHKICGYLCIFG